MTSEIGGGDTYILSVDPNSDGITILSGTGPAGPAGAPGEPGPEGPAFQGNAIALINPATGEAYLPGEALLVTGSLDVDVTIPPIDIEFPANQNVTITNPQASIAVSNFPAVQPISGSISVSNLPAVQPVSGSVTVSNFPVTQPVSGSVSVSNFPATQPVSVAAPIDVNIISGGGGGAVELKVGTDLVSDTKPLPIKVISGQVTITNPQTSVSVSNFPTTQNVAITGTPLVTVSNFPATQPVSLAAPISLASGSSVGIDGVVQVQGMSPGGGLVIDTVGSGVMKTAVHQTISGSAVPVDQNIGLYVQPSETARFNVRTAYEDYVSVAVRNETLNVAVSAPISVTREFTNLPVIGTVTINSNTTPVALASIAGKAVDVVNHTSTDVEYRLGGTGAYMVLAAKSSDLIYPITNANQISFRLRAAGSPLDLSFKVYS